MPAGAIGSVWASGSWTNTSWEANTWANAVVPPSSTPSKKLPTRLSFDLVPSQLSTDYSNGLLSFLDDVGATMSTPLRFARTETGPITLLCDFVDGTTEDLSTASAVTLKVVNANTGTVVVSNVALTSKTSVGTAIWTRTALQTATAGDYVGQVTVTRADATLGIFPDAQQGVPITVLPLIGE